MLSLLTLAERYTSEGRAEGEELGLDKGQKIITLLKKGMEPEEIAKTLNVPVAIVHDWKKLLSAEPDSVA